MSLLNEMELSDSESRSMNNSRSKGFGGQIDEEEDDDGVECEHPPGTNMATLETKEVRTTFSRYAVRWGGDKHVTRQIGKNFDCTVL